MFIHTKSGELMSSKVAGAFETREVGLGWERIKLLIEDGAEFTAELLPSFIEYHRSAHGSRIARIN